jgi:ABC-type branched-subunit amino acid transport system permease subunit
MENCWVWKLVCWLLLLIIRRLLGLEAGMLSVAVDDDSEAVDD